MNKDDETPWYKWQFSSGGLVMFVLFTITGTSLWLDGPVFDRYFWIKLACSSLFLGLAAIITYFEWKNRKPFRFRL